MAGPLIGMIGKAGGAMFGSQVGAALGGLAGEVLTASDIGLPLGPAGKAALVPAQHQGVRRGPRRHRRRRAALPLAARGRPPAAVRPRPVAAPAPDLLGRGLRPRRHHRHLRHRAGDGPARPDQHGGDPGGPAGRPVRAPADPRAEGRPGPARDHARARRGLGRRGRRPGHRRADAGRRPRCRRRSVAAGPPAVPRRRPSPRSSASSCVPDGCATPRRCGARCARARARRPATPSGPTPTCCRRPTTSTTRWASARTCPRSPSSATRTSTRRSASCSTASPAPRTTGRRPERRGRRDRVTLYDDAVDVLTHWQAPTEEQELVRAAYVDAPPGAPRRPVALVLPRPPHRRRAGAQPRPHPRAAQPAPQGAALVPLRRPPRGRRHPGRRRPARGHRGVRDRRAWSSTPSRCTSPPIRWSSATRAARCATSTYGSWPAPARTSSRWSARSRSTCAGGRSTTCPPTSRTCSSWSSSRWRG